MSVEIEMDNYVCPDCAGVYAYPKTYKKSDCPFCLKRERDQLQDDKYDLYEERDKEYRKGCALKGVITRLKNRLAFQRHN